jgi:hypothetical protein
MNKQQVTGFLVAVLVSAAPFIALLAGAAIA